MHPTDKAIQGSFHFAGRNRNLPWYPRKGSRDDLAVLFRKLGFNQGAEIGTRFGTWAKKLCTYNPNLSLSCIDPWSAYNARDKAWQDQSYARAIELLVTKKDFPGTVQIIRQTSMDALNRFQDGSLDFVFIDGNHDFEYAMEDIIKWSYKVRQGGIVAVHDYHPYVGYDVVAAVEAYTRCKHIDPWYVTREREPTAFWVKP